MGGTAVVESPARGVRIAPPVPAARVPARAVDPACCAVLYLVGAAWFRWLAATASSTGVLTGEEASIALRDPLALLLRWQPSIWSTNVGGAAFYGLAQHLEPHLGLLSARPAKAAATALLLPLVYLVARRRLGCGVAAAVAGAVTVALLPGVSTMSWVGIETPLDTVAGVAALSVVTSRRAWWPAGLVLAGLSVSIYTAGLAWAGAVLVVAVVRIRSVADVGRLLAGAAAGAAVVLWPLAWWRNGGVVVTGGGHGGADPAVVPARLAETGHYLTVDGSSYYFFGDQPMLGQAWLAALLAGGVVVVGATRSGRSWPWFLAAALGAALYAVSPGVPGARRLVVLCVVAALVVAVTVDLVRATPLGGPGAVVAAVAAVLVVGAACVPGTLAWHGEVLAGTRTLPVDWPLHPDPGGVQATLDRLDADLRAGRTTVHEVATAHGGTRTLAMIWVLHQQPTPPFPADEIVDEYWRSSDRCALDGGCPAR